ncbi:partner and localizer of BRCA2 isoform X3 [Oncorhynchus kisutch]|uniref:partner and localizer of BRCA2 isoform X3 n=1 Tax=Oncorhynchus kisutch TaxID=8019 RepID=UPI0012DC9422|nr:partner and localizer of BRCA2 isoform X3 [Oncorhynchus kisutch]
MEDNLERVLHCDDKEELRRKLALLQREYSRTVQRLQRAERSDAVRKHVRSRISEQNLQDQTDPVPASTFPNPALPPLSLGCPARTAPGSASPSGPAGDSTVAASCPVESENPRRRSPSIRFLLPVDDSCPRTPDLNPHRRSHSLRLRSRRSRLRWERTGRVQGGEGAGGRYDTETSEDGLELEAQTEKEEDGEKRNMEEEKEGVKKEVEREENEREIPDKEAIKQSDGEEREEQRTYGQKEIGSPLPSLRRDGEEREEQRSYGQKEVGSPLPSLRRDGEEREEQRTYGQKEVGSPLPSLRRDGEEREEQRTYGQKEIGSPLPSLRRDGEEREEGSDSVAVGVSVLGAVGLCNTGGVLDSCTLVEGLPFPVEYYIRTTRRMASSQSHRDLQAVVLNQLNRGRHRRNRGRMSNTHSLSTSQSDSLAQPSNHRPCSSQLTSNSPNNRTPVEEPSANQMLTAESGTNQSESLPSRACSVRPIRGRRRRGRRPRLGRSLSLDSDPPAPVPDNTQTPAAISPASQPLPGGGCPERWTLSGGVEERLYPIFRRSCVSPLIHTSKQSKESVWSLLLPSSLSPGGPAVHPGSLGCVISTFGLQDFHLPDDQFGQLKLQKLRASSAVAEPEPFSPYNMRRRRNRGSVHGLHGNTGGQTSKAPTPEPLPLSLTPPVTDCVTPVEQSIDRSIGQHLIDHPIGQQSTDALDHSTDLHSEYHSVCQSTDHPVDQHIGHQSTDQPVDQPTGHQSTDQPVDQPTGHQSTDQSVDQNVGHQSTDHPVDQPTGHQSTDQPTGHQSTDHLVDQPTGHQSTDQSVDLLIGHQLTVLVGQSIDFPSVDQQTGLLTTECPSLQTETETECPPECPSFHTKTKCLSPCPTEFSVECLTKCPSVCTTECPSLRRETDAECAVPPSPSLLLLSPSLTSHTPHRHTLSLSLSSIPPLPSLGMTPSPLTPNPNIPLSLPDSPPLPSLEAVTLPLSCPPCRPTLTLPLSCSPCPPTLTLPFPSSPSTQALSPPSLSPCPSPIIPLSSPPPSLALCHPNLVDSLPQLFLPPTPLLLPQSLPPTPNTPPPSPPIQLLRQPAPSLHSTRQATEERGEGEEERAWRKKEEKRREGMTEEGVLKLSHTLKAPAGGSLVDVCCVSWLSVGVCIAVAGEWEVCVWGQNNPPHWRRLHTWTFIQSVMSVFPVSDAPGLLCVTLGQLEIREARVLCCSSLSQAVLCEGEIHMVVGMSNRRLVSSSYSVATTPLQVYTLTQDGRLQACLSLVCPTERVQTVAAVEGQTDALIGSTHGGHVVLWNVTTGQLLRSINLGDGFTDTTCLRGYSLCVSGVLFVLLQHTSLCAVEEEEGGALFSLVATNPLTGTVALATRLGLPKACTGRLVEVDVHGSSVIGVFRSGSVCVWQLGGRQGQQGVWFPELGCQLARWGAQGTVLTAHLNGDVCLHRYRPI